MKVFEEMNISGKDVCPICKTKEQKEVVLIPIIGTGDKPNKKFQNYEAVQVHLDCLNLWYDKEKGVIFQVFKQVICDKCKIPVNSKKSSKNCKNIQIKCALRGQQGR